VCSVCYRRNGFFAGPRKRPLEALVSQLNPAPPETSLSSGKVVGAGDPSAVSASFATALG
jgi:hypothetical protein